MSSTRCILASLTLTAVFLTSFTPTTSFQLLKASVESPASPPAPDCFTALLNMSDCLTFVEQGSNLTQPDTPCCSELAGLVDTNPVCLCRLLGSAGSFGVQIDQSRVMKLPDVCQVSIPPVSLCAAAGVPVGGPVASSSPAPSPSPSGSSDTSEALTPSTVNNENGASSFKDIALLMLTSTSLVLLQLIL